MQVFLVNLNPEIFAQTTMPMLKVSQWHVQLILYDTHCVS